MDSKRLAALIGLALVGALGAGVILRSMSGGCSAQPRASSPIGRPTSSEESPPSAPEEFRTLGTAPVDEAVPLIKLLRQEGSAIGIRTGLEEIYLAAGYHGAARFFGNTARLVRGEALDVSPVVSPIAWSADADFLSDRPQQAAKEISKLSSAGRYGAAIERAKAEIQEHGLSLQVVVEWSDAVLWKVIEDRSAVNDEAVEVAVRILLISIEEQISRPHGIWSRAAGFGRASNIFLALGDPVSSLTAAILALATEERGSPPEGLGDFSRRQLCARIAELERQTRLSAEPSRAELCGR